MRRDCKARMYRSGEPPNQANKQGNTGIFLLSGCWSHRNPLLLTFSTWKTPTPFCQLLNVMFTGKPSRIPAKVSYSLFCASETQTHCGADLRVWPHFVYLVVCLFTLSPTLTFCKVQNYVLFTHLIPSTHVVLSPRNY